jgi:hypothetical protein
VSYTPSNQKFREGEVDHVQRFTDAVEQTLEALGGLRAVARQRVMHPEDWQEDHLRALMVHATRWSALEGTLLSELAMVKMLGSATR